MIILKPIKMVSLIIMDGIKKPSKFNFPIEVIL